MVDLTELFGSSIKLDRKADAEPPEIQLMAAMQAAGIEAPTTIKMDGQVHRFSTGKKKDLSGWYVAFNDGIPAAAFGDWRNGIQSSWMADIGRELSLTEQMANAKRMSDLKAIREREMAQKRESAADNALNLWNEAKPAPDAHPYLVSKNVNADGLRITDDYRLIIPIYVDEKISSVQFINADGWKKFLPGGAIKGGQFALHGTSDHIFVCEGMATGKSIHQATNGTVYIAFSANNLADVCKNVRQKHGITSSITLVADNDETKTGERYGKEAADAIGARFVMPPELGDANDYVNAGHDLRALLLPEVKPSGFHMIGFNDILKDTQPLRWIIKGIMPEGSLMMIHGPSGGGKSFVALDMAMHIATSKDLWCGHRINNPGTVAYLAGEGHHGIKMRLQAWARFYHVSEADFFLSDKGTDLNTPQGYMEVVEALKALPEAPNTIYIDTLHRFLMGDENSAQDAKTMIDACAGLSREFNCTVVLVHHTGVSEEAQHRARGSSAWRGALDAEMSIVPGVDGGPLQIVQRKQKDAELASDIWMQIEHVAFGYNDEDGDPVGSAVVIQSAPAESAKLDEITAKAQSALIETATTYGKTIHGTVNVTDAHFNEWSKGQDWKSDDQRRKTLQRYKQKLIDAAMITKVDIGYDVTDATINGAIKIILRANT